MDAFRAEASRWARADRCVGRGTGRGDSSSTCRRRRTMLCTTPASFE